VHIAFDEDRREDARSRPSSSNLSISTVLVYGSSSPVQRNTFAQDFGREKALAAVGQLVLAVDRLPSGRCGLIVSSRRLMSSGRCADSGTSSANSAARSSSA
jgi:hypothetical protein